MIIVFWMGWLIDVVILFIFLSTLLKTYASGVLASKSKQEMFQFIAILAGLAVILKSSLLLYHYAWLRTSALLASVPFLILFCILVIPIIAWLSGARMN